MTLYKVPSVLARILVMMMMMMMMILVKQLSVVVLLWPLWRVL
jgi:hypothetical protein